MMMATDERGARTPERGITIVSNWCDDYGGNGCDDGS